MDTHGPHWLKPLLQTKFFNACADHVEKNNECNLYCLDCAGNALCSLCTLHHRKHRMFQIRRSSYHDVIRVSEIQKVLDICGVQTYVINSARVVFLNQRPQPKPTKQGSKACDICDRGLLEPYIYCSLGCKLAGIMDKRNPTFTFRRKVHKDGSESAPVKSKQLSIRASRSQVESSKVPQLVISDITPGTPPSTSSSSGLTNPIKRRKGTPHRAPLAGT